MLREIPADDMLFKVRIHVIHYYWYICSFIFYNVPSQKSPHWLCVTLFYNYISYVYLTSVRPEHFISLSIFSQFHDVPSLSCGTYFVKSRPIKTLMNELFGSILYKYTWKILESIKYIWKYLSQSVILILKVLLKLYFQMPPSLLLKMDSIAKANEFSINFRINYFYNTCGA